MSEISESSIIIEELIKEAGRASERWGLSSVLGQVWGTLYFKSEMTQDELKKELDVGLSSISQAITILENLGFISTNKKKGRKKVYCAQISDQIVKRIFENALRFEINPIMGLIESRKNKIENKELKTKTEDLLKNLEKTSKLINLFLMVKK